MKKLLLTCVLLGWGLFVHAQSNSITGSVTDATDGSTLPGVSIVIKGTLQGTTTDSNGNYTIVAASDQTLVFSYIGYTTEEVQVGNRSVIDLNLQTDIQQLAEVVVTAFGLKQETKKLGYSVQDVDSETLAKVSDPNLGSALQGKLAGVNINSNAGGIGSSVSINVRGVSSLGLNNQPLLVLDGVIISSNQGAQAGFDTGIDYGNTLSNLNPNDVESVSLLKGGNATALYGFRGINGVLVITTKKGTSDAPTVEFNSATTISSVLIAPELQNEYGQGRFDTGTNQSVYDITQGNSFGPRLDGSQQARFDGVGTTPYSASGDDFKDFFRKGTSFLNSIAISQGKDKYNYRLSYSRSDDESIVPGSKLIRQNFSVKLGAKLTDWLKVTGKVDYIDQYAKNRSELTGGQSNIVRALSLRPRNISNSLLSDNRLNGDGTPNNWEGSFIMNPYYTVNTLLNEDQTDRYLTLLEFEADITKGLKAIARLSQDHISTSQQTYNPLGAFNIAGNGRFIDANSTSKFNNYDLIFTYNKELSDQFSLGANVGFSHTSSDFENIRSTGETFLIPNFFSLKNFDSQNSTPSASKSLSNSVFASVNIGFNEYLFAEFTGRNDWSSTLPIENASFFYPSVGLSFVVSDAIEGIKGNNTLSYLKLRGSYAQTGNATVPFSLLNTYNISSNQFNAQRFFFFGNNEEGAGVGPNLKNPNLVPEISNTSEFGLDARFLNNRISLSATYYSVETENQILSLSLPPTSGAASQVINAGLITNKGIEITLSADIIDQGDFKWSSSVNYSKNENIVKELALGVEKNNLVRQFNGVVQIASEVNSGARSLFGSKFTRNDTGEIVYGTDGLPIVDTEIGKIGDAAPDAFWNWNNTFSYKRFTLGFLLDARVGGDIFSFSEIQRHTQGTSINTLEGREFFTGGQGIPVPANAAVDGTLDPTAASRGVNPEAYWSRLGQIGENWVFDGSYVKLREVSIGYSFPVSTIQKLRLSNLSISYIGRNLAILHKNTDNFDPETGFNTSYSGVEYYGIPSARSHGFKLSATF